MKDECKAQSSPVGIRCRHGEADDFASGRALAYESRRESYASILGRARREEVTVEAEAPMPLELGHWSMHSHSALFCEVGVNEVTGEVRVRRFLGSFDCGRILNAKTAASQFRGGIIMGLGLALMEEVSFDERSGRIMNPSLAEYHVPVHLDVPEIDVIWTDEPDPHAPVGARGVGEERPRERVVEQVRSSEPDALVYAVQGLDVVQVLERDVEPVWVEEWVPVEEQVLDAEQVSVSA